MGSASGQAPSNLRPSGGHLFDSQIAVVVGGQYGSEGKGAIAAYLSASQDHLFAVRVGGPNAGHTVLGRCTSDCARHAPGEHPWRLRHIPVAAVVNLRAQLHIAAGSEVDPEVLYEEVVALDKAGYDVSHRLTVSEQATVILPDHVAQERMSRLLEETGSTCKGVGAARADRLWRHAPIVRDRIHDFPVFEDFASTQTPMAALHDGMKVLIEGTQGYGLGLHTPAYPQVTSGDATALDFLAQAQVTPWSFPFGWFSIFVVFRTHPIRVAGNSGPLSGETTWNELGLEEELTTVTRKVRRVGEWDGNLARQAMYANGAPSPRVHAVLTMADHVVPALAGRFSTDDVPPADVEAAAKLLARLEADVGQPFAIIGTGPRSVIDRRGAVLRAL